MLVSFLSWQIVECMVVVPDYLGWMVSSVKLYGARVAIATPTRVLLLSLGASLRRHEISPNEKSFKLEWS